MSPPSRPAGPPASCTRPGPRVLKIPHGPPGHVEEIDRKVHREVDPAPAGLREPSSLQKVSEYVPEVERLPLGIPAGVETGTARPTERYSPPETHGEDPLPHPAVFLPFLPVGKDLVRLVDLLETAFRFPVPG